MSKLYYHPVQTCSVTHNFLFTYDAQGSYALTLLYFYFPVSLIHPDLLSNRKKKKIFGIKKEEDAERISGNDDWWCVTIRLMRLCVCRYIHFRFDSLYTARQWICLLLSFAHAWNLLSWERRGKCRQQTQIFFAWISPHHIRCWLYLNLLPKNKKKKEKLVFHCVWQVQSSVKQIISASNYNWMADVVLYYRVWAAAQQTLELQPNYLDTVKDDSRAYTQNICT